MFTPRLTFRAGETFGSCVFSVQLTSRPGLGFENGDLQRGSAILSSTKGLVSPTGGVVKLDKNGLIAETKSASLLVAYCTAVIPPCSNNPVRIMMPRFFLTRSGTSSEIYLFMSL